MEYSLIVELLNKHILNKPNMLIGAKDLDQFIKDHFQITFIEKIDIERLHKQFRETTTMVLSKEQVPTKIKSVYFGLVTLAGDNDTTLTTIHVSGSKSSPDEDKEWACDIDYKSNSYIILKDFSIIDSELFDDLDDKGAVEVIIFNGLLNLLLINSQDLIKNLTFNSKGLFSKPRHTLYLGTGFDSGDCYLIGNIK